MSTRYHTVTAQNLWEISAISLEVLYPSRSSGLTPETIYLDISRDGALLLAEQLQAAVRGYDALALEEMCKVHDEEVARHETWQDSDGNCLHLETNLDGCTHCGREIVPQYVTDFGINPSMETLRAAGFNDWSPEYETALATFQKPEGES